MHRYWKIYFVTALITVIAVYSIGWKLTRLKDYDSEVKGEVYFEKYISEDDPDYPKKPLYGKVLYTKDSIRFYAWGKENSFGEVTSWHSPRHSLVSLVYDSHRPGFYRFGYLNERWDEYFFWATIAICMIAFFSAGIIYTTLRSASRGSIYINKGR